MGSFQPSAADLKPLFLAAACSVLLTLVSAAADWREGGALVLGPRSQHVSFFGLQNQGSALLALGLGVNAVAFIRPHPKLGHRRCGSEPSLLMLSGWWRGHRCVPSAPSQRREVSSCPWRVGGVWCWPARCCVRCSGLCCELLCGLFGSVYFSSRACFPWPEQGPIVSRVPGKISEDGEVAGECTEGEGERGRPSWLRRFTP